MKQLLKIAGALVVVVCLLAVASYLTTSHSWDSGFPAGVFRLTIRDAGGKPVKGAALRVYRGGTRDLALGYPLDNHVAGQSLVSDASGQITAFRKRGGLQFGGHGWDLFWVIPMGQEGPRYDCEITADGYKPLKFRFRRLFMLPDEDLREYPVEKSEVEGRELPIYERTFTLER